MSLKKKCKVFKIQRNAKFNQIPWTEENLIRSDIPIIQKACQG